MLLLAHNVSMRLSGEGITRSLFPTHSTRISTNGKPSAVICASKGIKQLTLTRSHLRIKRADQERSVCPGLSACLDTAC